MLAQGRMAEARHGVVGKTQGWTIAAVLMLAGCARYQAAPLDLPTVARTQEQAALDDARIDAVRAHMAPDATKSDRDRLWLLAAILVADPKVKTARAAIATAEAQAQAQRHLSMPILTLTGEYANDPATSSPWLIGGLVDLPIDAGGRRTARLRTADLAVTIARYDFAEVVWSERMTMRRALVDRDIAARRIAAGMDMFALRDRWLSVVERQKQQGAASNVDVAQVRIARAAAAQALALAESQRAAADQTIAGILGTPAPGITERHWVWDDFDTPTPVDPDKVSGEARLKAIMARADLLRALAGYDSADAAYRGEIAKQYPALTLSPGYTWERGLVKLPLSVGFALPPFDLNRHAIAAAIRARDEAARRLEDVVAGAGTAVDAAAAERAQALAALEQVRAHDLPTAMALAHRADDRLAAGDIDRAQWVDAQTVSVDARLREIDALERAQRADAALEDAMRRPLGGPETMMTISALDAAR